MPISLHEALVPNFRQTIGAASALLEKAQAWAKEKGIEEPALVGHRLAPDMLPLPFQVKSLAGHSIGAIEGVRAGSYSPDVSAPPTDIAALQAILAKAEADLAALDPKELDSLADKDVTFSLRDMKLPFTGANFLLSFSVPNFYFHATTFYDILRNQGMPLGKRDFLGGLRLKM